MFHRTLLAGAAALVLAPAALAAQDTTPPKLTGFSLDTTEVNARQQAAQVRMRWAASDAGTGLYAVQVMLRAPSGRIDYANYGLSAAPHKAGATLAWTPPADAEPGLWRIGYVAVWDGQGNSRTYEANAIKRMGSATKVRVRNSPLTDQQPPQFVSGVVLTPQLSLSDRWQPGTNDSAYRPLRIQVHATDSGSNGRASGVASIQIALCGRNTGMWLYVGDGLYETRAYGETDHMGEATDQYQAWPLSAQPDVYDICQVSVWDHAGQGTTYSAPSMGGSDDLSALFPAGAQVTIAP